MSGSSRGRRLRIAVLAPPWIPVPPPSYGGIEEVVRLLCRGLVACGHDVTLFAAPGSRSEARVVEVRETPHPENMEHSLVEADHVAAVFDALDGARRSGVPFDVVHDHCPAVALAMADRLGEPLVHTLHGSFDDERVALYRGHGHKAILVALSRSQQRDVPEGIECRHVVPNPIDLDEWPFSPDKDDALLFIGRMDADKGPHRAIAAARSAGSRLVLAGPVQPDSEGFFAAEVEPHLDDDRVRYVGSLGGDAKRKAFARARALLMPIEWPEPFGLVMVEALAAGTPVIAFDRGAAPEIVADGETGYLVDDVDGMAAAIGRLDAIDPGRCRETVAERFGVAAVCHAYEAVYRAAIDGAGAPARQAAS